MTIQRPQLAGLLGLFGSLGWLSLNTVFSPDWGPPGSADYLGYETVNRLWAPAFALIWCGHAGLYGRYALHHTRAGRVGIGLIGLGLAVMMAGNIAEFWFLTNQPYNGLNARAFAWISVLLGWLALLIGLVLIGAAGLRQRRLPSWAAWLLILALPASLILIFSVVEWMGLPFTAAGLTASALAAWPAPRRG